MKEQIKEMDQELERYHKNNSALELTISDLRLKLEGMQREILTQRSKLSDADAKVSGFRTELHECIQHVQDPKALKEAVKLMYGRHVTTTVTSRAVEADITAEYTRQVIAALPSARYLRAATAHVLPCDAARVPGEICGVSQAQAQQKYGAASQRQRAHDAGKALCRVRGPSRRRITHVHVPLRPCRRTYRSSTRSTSCAEKSRG